MVVAVTFSPHLIIPAPQVSPAPNVAVSIVIPGLTVPSAIASQRARGMEAAEVLAYSSIRTTTFSIGKLSRLAKV